jgi:hypothetical protein
VLAGQEREERGLTPPSRPSATEDRNSRTRDIDTVPTLAAEIVPTFGTHPPLFIAHHAGGESAVVTAVEGTEDDEISAWRQAAS